MRIKLKNLLFLIISAGVISQVFISAANAILDVTFNKALLTNRIQWYWQGDLNSAKDNGRNISEDPMISFDLRDPNKQAKADARPPVNKYIFGADEAFADSSSTSFRIWSVERQSDNATYTDLITYVNPFGSADSKDYNIAYKYIKANPEKATINQVDEVSSLALPALTTTGKLTVFSNQTARADSMVVERKACQWEVKYTPKNRQERNLDMAANTGANLVLSTPNYTFNPGDAYKMRVKYQNLWDAWGEWSDEYTHTVGAIAGGGNANLPKERTYLFVPGINTFSLPFVVNIDRNVPANSIKITRTVAGQADQQIGTIGELINAINLASGPNKKIVTAFGWYTPLGGHTGITAIPDNSDANAGKPVGMQFNGAPLTIDSILSEPIVRDRAYQVTLKEPLIDFKLTGYTDR